MLDAGVFRRGGIWCLGLAVVTISQQTPKGPCECGRGKIESVNNPRLYTPSTLGGIPCLGFEGR